MLPTARRAAIRHRNPCIWRTYTTETTDGSESQRPYFASLAERLDNERAKIPRASMAKKSIYVRPWSHPASMAEAFAIIRGIERKYGRIRDFKWVRVSLRV